MAKSAFPNHQPRNNTMAKTMQRLFAACCLLLTVPSSQAADVFSLDKLHTQIRFSVNHLGFSHPQGRFLRFDGSLRFDAQHMETSSVDITMQTNSLQMGDQEWTEHVSGKQFFNVEKYPEMRFKSRIVEVTGPADGIIHGDFTLLGVTHPLDLKFHLNKAGPHPFTKKYAVGFSATGTLQRSDYGMNAFVPMVSDAVHLSIEVEARRQD